MSTNQLRQSTRSVLNKRVGSRRSFLFGSALLAGAALTAWPQKSAQACGCFATQTVATPVVQAGEKLVFSIENGIVTMHVQIQYSGKAADFGWLLPLPTIPKNSKGQDGIELGVDELFEQLEARTAPTYTLTTPSCNQGSSSPFACGAASFGALADQALPKSPSDSPLVKQDSVGPFNYAILKADNKTEMLNWLNMNGYVIASGSDAALAPYIRTGAYFLAVKLISGKSAGDLQPLVIRYQADLPMIPITLTQIASVPQLGILVWVLGSARAYPRNYFHTVINETQLDWQNNVQNYSLVVGKAIAEAQGKHAFITEYAGDSERVQRVLDTPGRFDRVGLLSTEKDPKNFVEALLPMLTEDYQHQVGQTIPTTVSLGLAMNGQFVSVVGGAIPMPAQLAKEGVSPSDYYTRIRFYLGTDRAARPSAYSDIEAKLAAFNPAMLVNDITTLIVQPTLAAGALLSKYPYLTRLYTVLSPEDMNLDPVFSFNASLPRVSNDHRATLETCGTNSEEPLLVGSDGSGKPWQLRITKDRRQADNSLAPLAAPYSERIEVIRDGGAPELQTDNRMAIAATLSATTSTAQGCATQPGRSGRSSSPLLGLSAATICALLLRRRRRAAQ